MLRDSAGRSIRRSTQRSWAKICGGGLVLALGTWGLASGALAFSNSFAVELHRYLGDWYEYARTPNQFEDNTLSKGGKNYGPCFAARTTYRADGNDPIRLKNSCERRASDGSTIVESIIGKAVLRAGTQGFKLQIAFGSGVSQFFQRAISGGGFPSWVYCIGPVNGSGPYDWAVVSGPTKDYIFVLTRARKIEDAMHSDILRCSSGQALPIDKLIFRQRDSQLEDGVGSPPC